jgi:hypothetical protein
LFNRFLQSGIRNFRKTAVGKGHLADQFVPCLNHVSIVSGERANKPGFAMLAKELPKQATTHQ